MTGTFRHERHGMALAALAFVVLATLNAGGYRFGVGDQAFRSPRARPRCGCSSGSTVSASSTP
jgi:hypothetical protein